MTRELITRVLSALFEQHGTHRVVAQVEDRDTPAQRLLERAHFRCEASGRDRLLQRRVDDAADLRTPEAREALEFRSPRHASRSSTTADERDADLDRILIGGREKRSIVIVDYDDQWPARFEHQRGRVRSALGAEALSIEHIGSTAVPGLAAKPIIDMLVTVRDPDDESTFAAALASAGYHLRVREPEHRMFRTPEHDVHVHVWRDSNPDARRQLNFRDRLRSSADDRRAYACLKRELATRDWPDMNAYADAKGALIEEILDRAGPR